MTWQPMETAPADGRKVLLALPGYHVRSGRWIEGWGHWEGSDNDDRLIPVGWAPLPEPPA